MTAPMHQRSVVAEASGRWQPWNFHPWEGLQKFTDKIPVVVPVNPQAEPLKPARRRGSPGIEDSLRQSLRRARTASITCRHREGALSSPALQSHSITAALESPPPPFARNPQDSPLSRDGVEAAAAPAAGQHQQGLCFCAR